MPSSSSATNGDMCSTACSQSATPCNPTTATIPDNTAENCRADLSRAVYLSSLRKVVPQHLAHFNVTQLCCHRHPQLLAIANHPHSQPSDAGSSVRVIHNL